MEWLMRRAPGFGKISHEERDAINEFIFLWSLFEARILENSAQSNHIRMKVDAWKNAGTLNADQFERELSYFRSRYFAKGKLTHHFPNLRLRDRDHPEIVEAVMKSENDDPRDKILALLMIVWRLRNNLFHGEKWAYELRGQFANFTHANAVVVRLLDQHGQLG